MQRHHPQAMNAPRLHNTNYSAYGVEPPTAHELERIIEIDLKADDAAHKDWPDPKREPNRLQEWRNRMTHRMQVYLKHRGIDESSRHVYIRGYKMQMESTRRFDWAYARELADTELGIRADLKGETVLDDIPPLEGHDMTKQQAPKKQLAPSGSVHLPIAKPREITTSADLLAAQRANDAPATGEMSSAEIKETARAIGANPLAEEFPRCKIHNVPMDDDGACPTCRLNSELSKSVSPDEKPAPAHWSKDDKQRGGFWGDVNSLFNKYDGSRMLDSAARRSYVHAVIKFDSISESPMSRDEMFGAIRTEIIKDFATEKPVETSTPVAPVTSPEAPKVEIGTTLPAPIMEAVPNAPLPAKEKGHMTEAPFSANFRMLNQLGVEVQFTIRDEVVKDGVDKVEKLIPLLMERGYTPSNGGRSHVSAQASASAPVATMTNGNAVGHGNGSASGDDGGIVSCVTIKMGASYEGGKPQLEFECDGLDYTLKYTRGIGDMVKLLSRVKQPNGNPFTAEDLTVGRKFGGAWRVKWAPSKSSKYRDVLEVMPA